ncbi:fimbrillin family protein [Leyella stercorea]|uniref:fimbrillin family protein n=1 Tax=Leyella stercorea TaxID=363265 RepID=UPI003A94764E
MKKILYSVFMLATMVLAACSSEDTTEPDVKRGMVLKANVEDTDTRATITDNEGKWKFAFATGDEVKVGNDKVTGYYTFTNDGTVFTSTDAQQTTEAATWCAFFPGEQISLANQSGTFADVATKYALAGATATATTGSDGLTVTMKAKAAVLRIVGVNKDDILDISVKTDDGYVSGLTAVKNSADFKVETKDTKVSLLSKQGAGVYYVVVPAGVKLSVYKGKELIKATKAAGLTAGKYYTLKTGDVDGEEDATIDGVVVKKKWVQLWPGGPKFATENVAKTLNKSKATAKGSAYVWGANWRTPTKEELNFVNAIYDENLVITPLNAKAEIQVQNGVPGILYTGIQPGYTDKTLFLPTVGGKDKWGYYSAMYLTSTVINQGWGSSLDFSITETLFNLYYFMDYAYTAETTTYLVRPVLNK